LKFFRFTLKKSFSAPLIMWVAFSTSHDIRVHHMTLAINLY